MSGFTVLSKIDLYNRHTPLGVQVMCRSGTRSCENLNLFRLTYQSSGVRTARSARNISYTK